MQDGQMELTVLFGVTIAFLITSCLAIALRVYVRAGLLHRFGWDDFSALLSLACFIALAASSFISIQTWGSALSDFDTNQVDQHPASTYKLDVILSLDASLYILTMIFAKISLGVFFTKLFPSRSWQSILVCTVTALSVLYGIVYLAETLSNCGVRIFVHDDACSSKSLYYDFIISWSVLNAATDLVYPALSVQTFWTLNMPLATKLSACALLVFGTLGGVASCVRVALIVIWQHGNVDIASAFPNLKTVYLTSLEAGIAITVSSLMTLRPLVPKIQQHVARLQRYAVRRPSPANISHELDYPNRQDWKDKAIKLAQGSPFALESMGEMDSNEDLPADYEGTVGLGHPLQTHNLA